MSREDWSAMFMIRNRQTGAADDHHSVKRTGFRPAGWLGWAHGHYRDLCYRILVRNGSGAMVAVARVIVGASGSPGSVRALRYAEGLARSNDAALLPVIAWEPPGRDHLGRGVASGYLRQQWRDLAWQQLRDALVAVWGEVPCTPLVQPHVEMGRPGWVLVSLASRSDDLLVIGAGRRGALARIVCSRVSRYCLARARCPVLAVPPPELRRGPLRCMFRHRPLTVERLLQDSR